METFLLQATHTLRCAPWARASSQQDIYPRSRWRNLAALQRINLAEFPLAHLNLPVAREPIHDHNMTALTYPATATVLGVIENNSKKKKLREVKRQRSSSHY